MLASGISLLAGTLTGRGPLLAAQPLKTATPVSTEAAEAARLTRYTRSQRQMGVEFRISVYAAEEEAANSALDAAFARIARLNGILSDYDPTSELRRLCDASPPGTPVPVSDELWHVLAAAQRLAAATNGRFDVTVGPLVRLWRRARRQKELPSPRLLSESRKAVGHQLLRLHAEGQRVELLRAGMRLDLGGIAKGYAAAEAVRVLRERGLPRALVDGSGDIVAGDPPPGTTGWTIAIAPLRLPASAARTPAETETVAGRPAEPAAAILLRQGAVATSGDA
ncbi:MAG: FAD:protein FMN transferase, partial [Planctomycetaceae bacterium]|nr:FAD:protein FMN transferase [Planctomycetaceae bacterium]